MQQAEGDDAGIGDEDDAPGGDALGGGGGGVGVECENVMPVGRDGKRDADDGEERVSTAVTAVAAVAVVVVPAITGESATNGSDPEQHGAAVAVAVAPPSGSARRWRVASRFRIVLGLQLVSSARGRPRGRPWPDTRRASWAFRFRVDLAYATAPQVTALAVGSVGGGSRVMVFAAGARQATHAYVVR